MTIAPSCVRAARMRQFNPSCHHQHCRLSSQTSIASACSFPVLFVFSSP